MTGILYLVARFFTGKTLLSFYKGGNVKDVPAACQVPVRRAGPAKIPAAESGKLKKHK